MGNKSDVGTVINPSDGSWSERIMQSIPSSYTVWKDGSTYRGESNVDVGSDISDDDATTVIQACVTALAATGGRVFIRSGTYSITSTITVGAGVTIEGETQADDTTGPGTTLIRTTDAPIFTFDDERHFWVKHLYLRGVAKGTGATALVTLKGATGAGNIHFVGVTFGFSGGCGVDMAESSYWVTMDGCQALYLTGALIQQVWAPGPLQGTCLTMINCVSHWSGSVVEAYGIKGVNIIGGGCDNLDGFAYKFTVCTGVMQGVDLEGITNGHGVWMIQGSMNIFGNRFYGCGNVDDLKVPIYASGACKSAVSGNNFEATGSSMSLALAADIDYLAIEYNEFDKPITGYNLSSTVHARYNKGFQTIVEGKGTAGTGTSLTFPYALAGVPNIISLTVIEPNGTNKRYTAWVDSTWTDSTAVKIMLWDLDDAALEYATTTTVAYRCEYKPSEG